MEQKLFEQSKMIVGLQSRPTSIENLIEQVIETLDKAGKACKVISYGAIPIVKVNEVLYSITMKSKLGALLGVFEAELNKVQPEEE